MIKRNEMLLRGLTPSTRARYDLVRARYEQFCESEHITAFPSSDSTFQLYAAFRAGEVSGGTIEQELSAINSVAVDMGWHPVQFSATLKRMLRGATAMLPSSATPQDAMTMELLLRLVKSLDVDVVDGATLACAYIFCFFGLFRPGELTARSSNQPSDALPRLEDVTVSSDSLAIRLRSSKTSLHKGRPLSCAVFAAPMVPIGKQANPPVT